MGHIKTSREKVCKTGPWVACATCWNARTTGFPVHHRPLRDGDTAGKGGETCQGDERELCLKRKCHACKSLQQVKAGYPRQKLRGRSSLETLFQQLVEHLVSNANICQAIPSWREKLLISPTQATQATGCSQWEHKFWATPTDMNKSADLSQFNWFQKTSETILKTSALNLKDTQSPT